MSITLDYRTTEPVKPAVKRRLEQAAEAFCASRRWWAESLNLFEQPDKKGHLAGSTKIARVDAVPRDDQFMAEFDTLAILEQLIDWSGEHRLSWEVHVAGEKCGAIKNGKPDASLRRFRTATKEFLGTPAQAAKRAEEIHREYSDEPEPERAAAPADIKALRKRWTRTEVARINKVVGKKQSTASILAQKNVKKAPLPPKLLEKVNGAESYWDSVTIFKNRTMTVRPEGPVLSAQAVRPGCNDAYRCRP